MNVMICDKCGKMITSTVYLTKILCTDYRPYHECKELHMCSDCYDKFLKEYEKKLEDFNVRKIIE